MRARTLVEDGGVVQSIEDDDEDSDVDITDMHASTRCTNTSDYFAHRGRKLQTMPFDAYRMYVRRILGPRRAIVNDPTIFRFEPHYALPTTYAQ